MDLEKPKPIEEMDPDELPDTAGRNERFPYLQMLPFRILVWALAILLVLSGILWLGQAFGILGVLLTGELTFFEGWLWGVLGLLGLVLLIILVYNARSS
jgi:hypothetical protein